MSRAIHNRIVFAILACAIVVASTARGDGAVRTSHGVMFPDFPLGVAMIQLGQSLTIHVDAQHAESGGVTWTCVGKACTELTATSRWATFTAKGLAGTATITATSIREPNVSTSLTVTVNLNLVPDMLCEQRDAAVRNRNSL